MKKKKLLKKFIKKIDNQIELSSQCMHEVCNLSTICCDPYGDEPSDHVTARD